MVARTASNDGLSQSQSHSQSESPSDTYFNDLSRQPSGPPVPNDQQPKSKRMACVLCRKRKLKCDGARPACATCARLSHDCVYDEIRKKSGPKRGYVKALEARLAQVETMLKTQDPSPPAEGSSEGRSNSINNQNDMGSTGAFMEYNEMDIGNVDDSLDWTQAPGIPGVLNDPSGELNPMMNNLQHNLPASNPFQESWGSLIGLNIEEPLPSPDIIEELHQIYFGKIHSTLPLIHRPRYLMSMANSLPKLRPPTSLQYIVWAFAASVSDKYESVHRHYYERARHYYERDEMKGQGETAISVQHVQALFLISSYEFKYLMFPRAWSSTGRAARLALMLGLHRVDGSGMDVKQCLPPPKDWIEREERRRAYWCCFQSDRYASIGTGWPMSLDEADILTELPSGDEAFDTGVPETSITLQQALEPGGASKLSPLGGVAVLACLFGRNLLHLHRPGANENEESLSGDFWKRHRNLDNLILNISLASPEQLRLPMGIAHPNVVFMNMCLHTSTICLHQAAIFKAEKHRSLAKVSAESKVRCITAAAEIANIMKLASHMDMAGFNPFTCFCLYVSARVFVQYMKSRPSDENVKSSLYFMLAAMHAMKKKNPLAESFLVQLDVDLESAGLDDMRHLSSGAVVYFQQPGGCPIEAIMPTRDGTARRAPATYGDGGLAKHSAPTAEPEQGFKKWLETPGPAGETGFHGIVPVTTVRDTFNNNIPCNIPVRPKSPSITGRSPQTLSPDMDMSGSNTGSNGPTPPSMHADSSGRVSSVSSISPPSASTSQDDPLQSFDGPSTNQMRYQNGIFANSGFSQLANADQNMNFNNNNDSFTFSTTPGGNYDFTQFTQLEQDMITVDFDGSSKLPGMTPITNVADLGSMSDEEFNSMMNGASSWSAVGMDQNGSAQIYRMSGR